MYVYMYAYMCVWVCVCVCVWLQVQSTEWIVLHYCLVPNQIPYIQYKVTN